MAARAAKARLALAAGLPKPEDLALGGAAGSVSGPCRLGWQQGGGRAAGHRVCCHARKGLAPLASGVSRGGGRGRWRRELPEPGDQALGCRRARTQFSACGLAPVVRLGPGWAAGRRVVGEGGWAQVCCQARKGLAPLASESRGGGRRCCRSLLRRFAGGGGGRAVAAEGPQQQGERGTGMNGRFGLTDTLTNPF